jgi:hypothetical protein
MFRMENRRDILRLAGISAALGVPLTGAGASPQLGNLVTNPKEAMLARNSFGNLRVFLKDPPINSKW